MTQLYDANFDASDYVPKSEQPCEDCGKAQDIASEQIKIVTDRLDAMSELLNGINSNLTWLCQTVNNLLNSIPRNGMAGLMMRKALNQHDSQGQENDGD